MTSVIYIIILRGTNIMNIIVNNTSMQPIYEQIVEQIKGMIIQGTMKQEEVLHRIVLPLPPYQKAFQSRVLQVLAYGN